LFIFCSKEECALHAAVANSDKSVVRLLLKAGADAQQRGKK
jgi:ankyrin repeat protein